MGKKILVVDDEKAIVKGLKYSLIQDGFEVDEAYDGEEALNKCSLVKYDAILLDLMLPKISGMEVCQQVREYSDIPIIMLTAKGEDMDKILGFESGADDYITKPFNVLEVKARIKAVLRRNDSIREKQKVSEIRNGDFCFDVSNRRVFIMDDEVNLTQREFEILELLVLNPGKVYSRADLLAEIWGDGGAGDERSVDVYIRRIREKIEEQPSSPKYLQTKWGLGYFYNGQS